MSKEERKVPELRFKGFHDDWEQRKLGEVSDITKLAGFEFTKYIIYSNEGNVPAIRGLNVKNGNFDFSDLKYIDNSELSKLSRSKLLYQDIVFTYVGTIGDAALVPKDVNWYLAPNVARIRSTAITPEYLFQILTSSSFKNKEIKKWITSSSQPALSMENIRKFNLSHPKYYEQNKVGSFLKEIDRLTVLHQRKINILKQIKKAHFNALFPNKNCKIPILRFNSFQEVWEESPLEEVGDLVRTSIEPQGAPDSEFIEYSMPAYDNGRLPDHVLGKSMQSMRLKISGQVLLINKLNVRQKRIWLIENAPYNAVASSEFMPFVSQTINLVFLEQYMLSDKSTRDLESISSGTSNSQKRVTPTDILKYHIKYPKKHNEQEKIGLYFKNIDDIIVLHQRKLNSLVKIKQIYLTKMFI